MKKELLIAMIVPHVVHIAAAAAIIALTAETLKKVNRMEKDMDTIGEKHGILNQVIRKIEERREKK